MNPGRLLHIKPYNRYLQAYTMFYSIIMTNSAVSTGPRLLPSKTCLKITNVLNLFRTVVRRFSLDCGSAVVKVPHKTSGDVPI